MGSVLHFRISNIFPIETTIFGTLAKCDSLEIDESLDSVQRKWVLVYEELNRRLFPEYQAWRQTISCTDNGYVKLNCIEKFMGLEIIDFMKSPTDDALALLFNKSRHYRGSPDVLAITVARNFGWRAARLVGEEETTQFWLKKFDELSTEFKMPSRISRRSMSHSNSAFYVLIEAEIGGYLLFGQATQSTPAVVRDLLGDKYRTADLLSKMGFSVPRNVLITNLARSLSDWVNLRNGPAF